MDSCVGKKNMREKCYRKENIVTRDVRGKVYEGEYEKMKQL